MANSDQPLLPASAVPAARPGPLRRAPSPRPRKLRLLRWFPDAWVLATGPTAGNALYLTFDDGPHPEHTPRMLDLLARHEARATFFVIGERASEHPVLMRRIVEEGHALGNHSWSHPRFERLSRRERLDEVGRTDALLRSFDGRRRHDFRPPHGATPPGLLVDCARSGVRIVHWSYDSLDYSHRDPVDLVATLRDHPVQSGDVILMHDDSAHSHGMLSVLLPEWRRKGHAFRAIGTAGKGA